MAKAKALNSGRIPAPEQYSKRETQRRFEMAVDAALRTKPIHKTATKPRKRAVPK